jgi:hypothetical protein
MIKNGWMLNVLFMGGKRMTNYEMMIDAVVNQIYLLYNQSDSWDEELSKQTAHRILEIIEEYKNK